MERLTYRTEDGWVGVNSLEDKTISPTSVAIHKLAEFEDLMEEYGLHNVEQIKDLITANQDDRDELCYLAEENKMLKDRWQKLKEWVIKELGYSSMYQEVRMDTLDEVKDKMQELEKDDE